MNTATHDLIEVFRQSMEHATRLQGQLQTLAITLVRADELPGLIGRCPYPSECQSLKDEQATIGHPVALRIRRSQLESELRQVHAVIGGHLLAAVESATRLVTDTAGGELAVRSYPFVRRVLAELARHRTMPPLSTDRPAFLTLAWQTLDAAVASLDEIRFDAQQRGRSTL